MRTTSGIRLPKTIKPSGKLFPPTAQELWIADLLSCFGLTDRQIGLAVGISEDSVGTSIKSTMRKLGFCRRIEIVKWRLSGGKR